MDKEHLRENDLVRRLSSEFKSKIVPSQIIPYLDVHRISREDEDLILAKETTEGAMAAAYLLLNRLSRNYDWFNSLLRTLRHEEVRLHHVACTFEEIKRQVDNHWNSLPQKNPHSVSDINRTTVNEFKFGKPKSDYVTDVGHSGRPYLRNIETAEKGEASMYVDARSADNKPDKTNECTEHKEDDGYATLNYSIQKSTDESDVYDQLENIHFDDNPEYHDRQRDTAAQSCSQVVEELEGARANETAILKEVEQNEKKKTETSYTEDSGKNTKRVTHEENKPTSHVCGSSYNHCEQQKLIHEEKEYTKAEVTQALQHMSNWRTVLTEEEVKDYMKDFIDSDGTYIIWFWERKRRPVISVLHHGEIVNFIVHKRKKQNETNYFIETDQEICSTLDDVVSFHIKHGIRDTRKESYGQVIRLL